VDCTNTAAAADVSGSDMNKSSRTAWTMLCCCMPAAYASPEVHICPMVGSIQQSDRHVIDSRHLVSEQEVWYLRSTTAVA